MNHTERAQPVRLAGQTSFLLAGNVFTLVAGLPFQVYLSRTLGAEGLGLYGLLEGVAAVIMGIVGLGVAQTVLRYLPHHVARGEYAAARSLVRQGTIVVLLAGAVGYAVLASGHGLIISLWPEFEGHTDSILLYALTLPLGLGLHFATQAMRGLMEIRQVVIATSFVQFAVKAATAIVLLGVGFGVYGYIGAVVVSQLIAAIWLSLSLLRLVSRLPQGNMETGIADGTSWRKYAGVMYANSLLGLGTAQMDRFLLGAFANASLVGVLMIAKTLQGIPAVFLQVFIIAASPLLSAAHASDNHRDRENLYHLTTDWLVRVSAPLILFLLVFAEPVLALFGKTFAREGHIALWILLIGQTVNLVCGQIGNVLNMCGQEKVMLRISFQSTLILLLSLPPLVYAFGIAGASAALTASVIYSNISAVLAARKASGLRWFDARYRQWVMPTVVATTLAMVLRNHIEDPGVAVLGGSLLAIYGVFHVLHLTQGLSPEDRQLWDAFRLRLGIQRESP